MNDPRLAYRGLASAALALLMFFIRYFAPDMPNEFYPLFSGFYMAAWGAAEVFYDSRHKAPAPATTDTKAGTP